MSGDKNAAGEAVEVTATTSGAYDMTEISSSCSEGPQRSDKRESREAILYMYDVPDQTSASSSSEHDRELRNFPVAMTSRVFFLIACTMFLWLSIDDLHWAHDAQNIPETVLNADDDFTWQQFRSRQSGQNAGSTSVVDARSGSGGSGYVRTSSAQDNGADEGDEITLSDVRDGDYGGRRILRLALQHRRRAQDGDISYHTSWSDLPLSKQIAATTLGHDEASWNSGLPTFADLIKWDALTDDQKVAAVELGYNQYLWDMLRGFSQPTSAPPNDIAVTPTSQWNDLSFSQQIAATALGYDETSWNSGGSAFTDTIQWAGLSDDQRDAALSLGYNEYLWDMLRGFIPPRTPPPNTADGASKPEYGSMLWANLPQEIQAAASTLGYTEAVWNNGERTAVDDLFWVQLTTEQQVAATLLGYSQETWDVYADEVSGSQQREPNTSSTPATAATNSPATTTPATMSPDTTQVTIPTTNPAPAPTASSQTTLSPGETWRSVPWSDLPDQIRGGAIDLGFTEEHWNSGARVATDSYFWDELSLAQQQAAAALFGFSKTTWNASDNKWRKIPWDQLPSDIQSHADVLGFDEDLWDGGAKVDTRSYGWDEMSGEQQQAASTIFGLTEETWALASIRDTSDMPAENVKNNGGGRGGGRGGADDDYVFYVSKGTEEVWVSNYQIVYFVGSLCFTIVGILDIFREGRLYHILMILGGIFSVLAAMWVESNLTTSDIFDSFSMQFFVLEGVTRFFYRPKLRALLPGPGKNALWMADICFVVGATLKSILSYIYLTKDDARENLHIARTDSFAALVFLLSGAIYLAITPVVFLRNTKLRPYR